MSPPSNLVELLRRRGAETPEKVAFRFLADADVAAESLTYRELSLTSEALAVKLQAEGCEGERVLFHHVRIVPWKLSRRFWPIVVPELS